MTEIYAKCGRTEARSFIWGNLSAWLIGNRNILPLQNKVIKVFLVVFVPAIFGCKSVPTGAHDPSSIEESILGTKIIKGDCKWKDNQNTNLQTCGDSVMRTVMPDLRSVYFFKFGHNFENKISFNALKTSKINEKEIKVVVIHAKDQGPQDYKATGMCVEDTKLSDIDCSAETENGQHFNFQVKNAKVLDLQFGERRNSR